MPKAKSSRSAKSNTEKKILQMPESSGNGNGSHASSNLESEIRVRAYELYEQRGSTDGRSNEDWLQAEREVMARHGQSHSA